MPLFYKGVGVGTHHHGSTFPLGGLTARNPGGSTSINSVITHIAKATTTTPFISVTRSYGVAEMYAYSSLTAPPTQANPGYVWEVEINDPAPTGVIVWDPLQQIAGQHNPLGHFTYQHDGDQDFIHAVADEGKPGAAVYLAKLVRLPGMQNGTRPPNRSDDLLGMVRALRDSEVLVLGTIPQSCFINRYPVW
jgi:hypothetical protein